MKFDRQSALLSPFEVRPSVTPLLIPILEPGNSFARHSSFATNSFATHPRLQLSFPSIISAHFPSPRIGDVPPQNSGAHPPHPLPYFLQEYDSKKLTDEGSAKNMILKELLKDSFQCFCPTGAVEFAGGVNTLRRRGMSRLARGETPLTGPPLHGTRATEHGSRQSLQAVDSRVTRCRWWG
jgi:hypothetical protein